MDIDRYIESDRIKNDLQEKKVFYCCEDCGCEIYDGNEYYEDNQDYVCENCFDKRQEEYKFESRKIAGE